MKSSPFQIIVVSVFGVLIVVTLVVLLLSKNSGSSAKNSVNLVLWGTAPINYIQAIASLPAVLQSGIKIEYKQINANAFDQQLIEALASGRGPDAVILSQDSILRYQDKIYPIPYASISERTFRDTYVSEAELFLSKDGIIGVPISIDPMVTYWNRDMFSSAGVSKPPQSWIEFLRLAETLTNRDNTIIKKSAVALGEFSNITNAKEIISAMALQSGVPITSRSSVGKSPAKEKVVGALTNTNFEDVISFYVGFSNPVKSVYTWSRALPNSQEMFAQGDLGVYFGFTSELSTIKAKNPNLDFDLTYFPQPRDANTKITFGKIYAVSAIRWSPKVSSAMQLAMLFGSAPAVKSWSDASGLPPVRRDLLANKPSDPYAVIYYDSALWSRGWLDPDASRTKEIFRDMIEGVTSGWMTTSSAISRANGEMGNLLGGQ